MKTKYQKYDIIENKLLLSSHTLHKFDVANSIVQKYKGTPIKVLDIGSGEGTISMKLLDSKDDIKITMIDNAKEEVSICRKIMDTIYKDKCEKVEIINKCISQLPADKYDIVLAFSVITHLISKFSTFDNVFNKIDSYVKDYLILEVPVSTDNSLQTWKNKCTDNRYDMFASIENLISYVSTKYNIIDFININYKESTGLNRYCFVLKKNIV